MSLDKSATKDSPLSFLLLQEPPCRAALIDKEGAVYKNKNKIQNPLGAVMKYFFQQPWNQDIIAQTEINRKSSNQYSTRKETEYVDTRGNNRKIDTYIDHRVVCPVNIWSENP